MSEYTNIDNAIFNITEKEEKEKRVPSDSDTAVYTVSGSQDFVDEDGYPRLEDLADKKAEDRHEAHAKTAPDGNKIKFFAKIGKHGRLYNPIGMYSEGTSARNVKHAGRPEWVFRQVTKKVFDYYIQFLKTKNAAWLSNAEREF